MHAKEATALAKSAEQLDSSRKESKERTSKHNEAKKQWTKDKKATAAQVVVLPRFDSTFLRFCFLRFQIKELKTKALELVTASQTVQHHLE